MTPYEFQLWVRVCEVCKTYHFSLMVGSSSSPSFRIRPEATWATHKDIEGTGASLVEALEDLAQKLGVELPAKGVSHA